VNLSKKGNRSHPDLGYNLIRRSGAAAVAQCLPAGLKCVNLAGNALKHGGADIAPFLRAGVKRLHVSATELEDDDAVTIAMSHPAALQHLSLDGDRIGYE
jgi:hypothetical protein